MSDHDDPLDLLAGERLALRTHDLHELGRERIRREAHAELARSAHRTSWARRTYRRVEPVLTAALAASYLFWAFGSVLPPK